MEGDYYGYAPTRSLQRHLALTGFMGAPVGDVARVLSSITGLPLFDVARGTEHAVGRSLAEHLLAEGPVATAVVVRRVAERMLASRPHGFVALTPDALLDPSLRRSVGQHATLVYLREGFDACLERLTQRVARSPRDHIRFLAGAPVEVALVRRLLVERLPAYESADVAVDIDGLHPRAIAAAVLAALPAGLDGMDAP